MLLLRRLSFLSFLWFLTITKSQVHPTAPIGRKEFTVLADRNKTAITVVEYMNLKVNPCEDFFEFACGKWIENRSIEGVGDMVTPQNELELGVLKDFEAILSDPREKEQRVINFYQSCCSETSNSPAQELFMRRLREQYGHRTNSDWLNTIAILRKRLGFNILIGFEIDTNMETFTGNSIYIGEPQDTIIPPEFCNAATIETMDKNDDIFKKLVENISTNMQKWIKMQEHEARYFALNIIAFEFELCRKMRIEENSEDDENADEENEIQPPTSARRKPMFQIGLKRIHGRSKNVVYLNELSSFDIDLKRYITIIINYQHNERIFLRNKPYFRNLAKQVKMTNIAIVENYILYRVYSEFNFPTENKKSIPRDHCARYVKKYFPKIVGELFQRHFHRAEYYNEVQKLFNDIKKTFDSSLNSDWIVENTKRAARQKLSEFKARFPTYHNLGLNNLLLNEQLFWTKLHLVMEYNAKKELGRLANADPDERSKTIEAFDVGAQLMPMDKEILVGWALFREPFYESYYPNAMKYAILGHRLARELVMAFDEEGWRPTPQNQRQWDELTEEGFRNQSNCFREQYSNYLYNNPDDFQNSTRLREIIADSSGLNLAFNAYLGWLENIDPGERRLLHKETLPNVNFTNTQLFFIHFAQTRCAAKPGESPPPDYLPLKKHTTQRYDVNGPLSNCAEFAREFGCAPGDEMHPVDKCVIY